MDVAERQDMVTHLREQFGRILILINKFPLQNVDYS